MAHNGGGHKVASVILRFLQLTCGAIVLGLLGRFAYLADDANVSVDGRIIYTMVVSGITIVFSICVCLPFDILFLSFLFDFILFIMWLVAFCLLETVGNLCYSFVDKTSILLWDDRERETTSAVHRGTATIGAFTGDAGGGSGDLALPSMEPDVRSGVLFSAFRFWPGFFIS
ncbi:uncharacterized protein FRV6_08563 [Fusarium oxysporum]|uniref:MARVEL domain-containing protein n=1 Tax=Fusarium oxysporum TaxID=5507 RepID=A0A2H3TMH6_FUSOX|nr:uncharacterized protein FRV6_08563 [Fusarium oxysporum]